MKILVRMVALDRHGFQGRSLHPRQEDVGLLFEVVAIEEQIMSAEGLLFTDLPDTAEEASQWLALRSAAKAGNGFCFRCLLVTDGKRMLQLMEHEIEPADISKE